jgi:DNA polymerase I-like protein with 3'-5' exonuclease and polymerase domains
MPTIRPKRTLPVVALDTECTGPNFREGDRPFSVALAWPGDIEDLENWETEFYSWPVDPFTREVTPDPADLKRIWEVMKSHRVVFHNAKFDIRAMASVGLRLPQDQREKCVCWTAYEDTLLASHVCDSSESHALKDLALKYLDIPDDDQKDLQDLVVRLRRKAKDLGWNLADNAKLDYWLPAAMALHEGSQIICKEDIQSWTDTIETYNVLDAKRTMALWMMYYNVLNEEGLMEQYNREKNLQAVVYRIENRGVSLLRPKLISEMKRYAEVRDECEATCQRIAVKLGFQGGEPINLRSNKQLPAFLYGSRDLGCLGLDPVKYTGGMSKDGELNASTDSTSIKELLQQAKETNYKPATEFLTGLANYKLNKTAAGYLEGYYENLRLDQRTAKGRNNRRYCIYPSLNQTGTDTTRFSHSKPNPANVGKGKEDLEGDIDFNLRCTFGPSFGRIWYAYDYDQLQLRIFAERAGEIELVEGFKQGYDAHDMVAAKIFDMTVPELRAIDPKEYKLKRRIGKNTNFGFIFGAGPAKIDATSGMRGLSKLLDKTFPHAKEFMEETISHVRRHGWVKTLGGYRLTVPKDRAYAGVCYIIQGIEGEIVKNAMIAVDDYLHRQCNDEGFITLQVHDELVLDFKYQPRGGRKAVREVKGQEPDSRMEHLRNIAALMVRSGANLGIETPVSCERIKTNWAEGEELDLGPTPKVRPYQKHGAFVGHLNESRGGRYNAKLRKKRGYKKIQNARDKKARQLARLKVQRKKLKSL